MTNIKKTTLVVESSDVNAILSQVGIDAVMDDLIARLEKALSDFNPQNTVIPARSGFHYTFPFTGLIEWMPLFSRGNQITVKLVGYHPSNPEIFNAPTILSSIYRFDTTSGHLSAIMDGVLPTALRTGAISAVATKLMAHPDSTTLGIIGCGAQAITQIHALSRVMNIDKVFHYDIEEEVMHTLSKRLGPLGIKCQFEPSDIMTIVQTSDVICTATSIDIGEGPLFSKVKTLPHLHINAVGSDFPGKIEIPLDFLRSGIVIPDFKAQAVVEGESQQLTDAEIGPELSALMKQPENYIYIKQSRSVFDSTGWALEDHVVMDMIVEYAKKLDLGRQLEIEYFPEDNKNPYEFLGTSVEAKKALPKTQQFIK